MALSGIRVRTCMNRRRYSENLSRTVMKNYSRVSKMEALTRNIEASGMRPPSPHALSDVMESLAEAQTTMGIRPPVLAYNQHAHKVYLIDRSLLFYRRYGSPRWP